MTKTVTVKQTKISIAAEVNDPANRADLKEYILKTLKGTALAGLIFEIDPASAKVEMKNILIQLERIIDLRSDTVYLWRMDPEKGELLRTKVSSH